MSYEVLLRHKVQYVALIVYIKCHENLKNCDINLHKVKLKLDKLCNKVKVLLDKIGSKMQPKVVELLPFVVLK